MKKIKKVDIIILIICLIVGISLFSEPLMVIAVKLDFAGVTHYEVIVDGESEDVYTFEEDVGKIIEKKEIELKDKDYILTEVLDKKTKIEVIRSYEEIVYKKESLPYEKVIKEDNNLEKGIEKVEQVGEEGSVVIEFTVVYENNEKKKEHNRTETIIKAPKDEIIAKGTKEKIVENPKEIKKDIKVSRGSFSSGKVVTMEATAYTHTGNKTATGIYPYVGVIAVDPKVIPLGTKVHVEGYGNAIAADTGGAIKGNIIDVFFNSRGECMNWGRKMVKVRILD